MVQIGGPFEARATQRDGSTWRLLFIGSMIGVLSQHACVFDPIDLIGYRCTSDAECREVGLHCEPSTRRCQPAATTGTSSEVGSGTSSEASTSSSGSGAGGAGPVELLASAQPNPGPIAVDAERVVWAHADSGGFHWPYRGCAPSDCSMGAVDYSEARPSVRRIVLDDGWLFASTSGRLEKCFASNCLATAQNIALNMGDPSQLAVDSTQIYFTNRMTHGVYRCSTTVIPCLTPTLVASDPLLTITEPVTPHGIAVIGGFVVWTNGSQVQRCPTSEANCTIQVVANERAEAFAHDTTRMYWATFDLNGVVKSCEVADCGGTVTTLAEGQGYPGALASDGVHLYWANRDGGKINRCRVEGCDSKPEVVAVDQDIPYGLALSSTHVYWTNRGALADTGTVMRARK